MWRMESITEPEVLFKKKKIEIGTRGSLEK